MKPSSPEAFKLMMEGSAAFTDMEERGMRIDTDYLDKAIKQTGEDLKQLKDELQQTDEYAIWRRRFGLKADLGKREQLAKVLFEDLGYEAKSFSEKSFDEEGNKKASTDEDSLAHIDLPFLKKWNWMMKLADCRRKNLIGLKQEVHDGYLHPFFNLHTASTYRSSSSQPNFHNQPIRDPRLAGLIRTAFIPREGCALIEIDFGALEFRGAACFWKDEAMIAYASDPDLDIHRDIAAECYLLDTDEVSKTARSYAKNQFVFPVLYGSYYKNTGPALWEMIGRADIRTKTTDQSLYDHLLDKGISTQEQFVEHIKDVEKNFNERFSHWSNEKNNWWNLYLERGWFPLMTGFVCQGIYRYNNLMNTPIQGPCFHLTLWSLIQLNKWLKKHKFKSMIIGQIHDSILLDAHKKEWKDVVEKAKQIMTVDVRKHWDWVVTPLEVECEGSHQNWFSKKTIAI